MRHKAQCRSIFASLCGRQSAVYVSIFIHPGILYSQLFHLLRQHLPQIFLSLTGRMGSRMRIACSVYFYVPEKSFMRLHIFLFPLPAFIFL